MIAIPSSYKCVVLSLTGQLLDLGHVCNIFAYRCFLFAIAMLRGPSWWHSAQLLFSILPWTSSQLLFSIHPWTSYQLLFSIHPWTSSQCELNTPVGLRPSCELNTPVGLRPSCDLNTPFGLRPSCQLNTPVSVRLSYELNTPVGIRPSCANLQYTPLPFPYLFPIESHRFKKKVLLKIIDFHHTHTTHNHTRTHTHTRTITHAHEQEKVLQVKKIPFAAAFPRRPFSSRSAVGVDLALNNPAKIQVLKKVHFPFQVVNFPTDQL